jgi:hypothetical protein
VVEQLRHNNSTDLIVLEQLIRSMAGIISDNDFNSLVWVNEWTNRFEVVLDS